MVRWKIMEERWRLIDSTPGLNTSGLDVHNGPRVVVASPSERAEPVFANEMFFLDWKKSSRTEIEAPDVSMF